jgi:hypothetical protein
MTESFDRVLIHVCHVLHAHVLVGHSEPHLFLIKADAVTGVIYMSTRKNVNDGRKVWHDRRPVLRPTSFRLLLGM